MALGFMVHWWRDTRQKAEQKGGPTLAKGKAQLHWSSKNFQNLTHPCYLCGTHIMYVNMLDLEQEQTF